MSQRAFAFEFQDRKACLQRVLHVPICQHLPPRPDFRTPSQRMIAVGHPILRQDSQQDFPKTYSPAALRSLAGA